MLAQPVVREFFRAEGHSLPLVNPPPMVYQTYVSFAPRWRICICLPPEGMQVCPCRQADAAAGRGSGAMRQHSCSSERLRQQQVVPSNPAQGGE